MALRRAAHQIYDRPVVFEDPYAVRILGETFREDLRRTPTRADRPFSVALRAFLVARSRFAEDTLAASVRAGTEQYVLLGAGLDTFAYRNPYPGLHVFEVDHPTTQSWKRDLVASSGMEPKPGLIYVPVNFEGDQLAERLADAGFDRSKKSLFAWLGVVPYLTIVAFRSTLRYIAGSVPGSELVADYLQPREVLPLFEQLAQDSIGSRVRQAGEPFQLFMTRQEVQQEMRSFSSLEDLGEVELNDLYFSGRNDLLRVRGASQRLLRARISRP